MGAIEVCALPQGERRRQSPNVHELKRGEAEALAFLRPLSNDYPGIERWYRTKVVPGLREGTRLLLPVERDGQIIAIGIAKREPEERKICTVRVHPAYYGRGIGVRIFDSLLHWLDADRPHLTISRQKLPLFERVFEYFGFELTSEHSGLYVPGVTELGYNEQLGLCSAAAYEGKANMG